MLSGYRNRLYSQYEKQGRENGFSEQIRFRAPIAFCRI